MKRLSHDDGSWSEFLEKWKRECHEFDEDFVSYMPTTLPMLADQIETCVNDKWSGVYGIQGDDEAYEAVCFLNGAFIPKFTGRVLRVRHLILAPKYDFGDYSEDEYARLLSTVFERVLNESDTRLPCPHVKVHFRSPADVAIFRKFAENLDQLSHFSSVKMVGSWLFVSKA
ncbi:hypothetical protein PXK01_05465 [Phaeobacter sp. PT47_59]|uniref:hypothetical protein n=1 Tax=Phaeobacter sp. PT47_59 TaxID=3029979 RepID=UPI0023809A04|nr:hypothetical protein [Phaeobacter sp. PT47_59]MDE4173592.1 hypothetical protein [Phaeobacter sp. PT47_59]